jgi:hypothetical protein
MNLRDHIENNIAIYSAIVLSTGFAIGFATDRWAKEVLGASTNVAECKPEVWEPIARKAEWMPLAQCPAFPLKLQITSPGNGTSFPINAHYPETLRIPVVVSASRPLPEVGSLGFVVKAKNSLNYFVAFPLVGRTRDTNTYRTNEIELPVHLSAGTEYEVRAVFVQRAEMLGDRFTSVEQILAADPSVVLTDPVFATAEAASGNQNQN